MGERRPPQPLRIIEIVDADRSLFPLREEATRSTPDLSRGGSPRSKRSKRSAIVLAVIGAGALVAVAISALSDDPPSVHPVPTTVVPERPTFAPEPTSGSIPASAITGGRCSDDRIPFRPNYLPLGWSIAGSVIAGVDQLTGGEGTVTIVHGPGVPTHGSPVSDITVLGVPAVIAPGSGGYVVEFILGAPSDPCDHWALLSSPPVAASTLQRIAEGLTTFSAGAATLACVQGYPTAEPDVSGRTLVLDALSLPHAVELPTIPVHLPNGVSALFAKEGLLVRAGVAFTISVARASAGRVGLVWQSGGAAVSTVIVPACAVSTPWLAFIGGYWVMQPECVALVVSTASAEQQVRVGVGTRCD